MEINLCRFRGWESQENDAVLTAFVSHGLGFGNYLPPFVLGLFEVGLALIDLVSLAEGEEDGGEAADPGYFGKGFDLSTEFVEFSGVSWHFNFLVGIKGYFLESIVLWSILKGYFAAGLGMNRSTEIQIVVLAHLLVFESLLNFVHGEVELAPADCEIGILVLDWTGLVFRGIDVGQDWAISNGTCGVECNCLFFEQIFQIDEDFLIFWFPQGKGHLLLLR